MNSRMLFRGAFIILCASVANAQATSRGGEHIVLTVPDAAVLQCGRRFNGTDSTSVLSFRVGDAIPETRQIDLVLGTDRKILRLVDVEFVDMGFDSTESISTI